MAHHPLAALSPEEISNLFAEARNAGDIESLLTLYEPGACLVSQTGEELIGLRAIEEYLRSLLALKGHMTIENHSIYKTGNTALLRARWHLTGLLPNGEPLDLRGISVEVVRQQPDGRWLYLIDHPFAGEG